MHAATLGQHGLEHDRRFVVVDGQGYFISQRSLPALALLKVSLHKGLVLTFRDQTMELTHPLGAVRLVRVWNDSVEAQDWGEEAHRFLTQILGQELWLCEARSGAPRLVSSKYTAEASVPYFFADGFPFLIVAEEYLKLLNQKLQARGQKPVAMDRFRPNIVISGWQAHAEDKLQRLLIGDHIEFMLAKPCSRCSVILVEQSDCSVGKEPLRTLATYRKGEVGQIFFGQNAYLLRGEGERIQVGDEVRVMECDSEVL